MLIDFDKGVRVRGPDPVLHDLESRGLEFAFPSAGYRGDYIRDIAADYPGEIPAITAEALTDSLPADGAGDDKAAKEAYVEALIARARDFERDQDDYIDLAGISGSTHGDRTEISPDANTTGICATNSDMGWAGV